MLEGLVAARLCDQCGNESRHCMRVSRLPEEKGFADFFECLRCGALSVFDVPPELSHDMGPSRTGVNRSSLAP